MRPTLLRLRQGKKGNAQRAWRRAPRRPSSPPRAAGLLLPVACFVLALASFNAAQQPRMIEQPDMTIDAATRTQVIEGTLRHLRDGYVFPEVAARMEQAIRERLARKQYDNVTSARQLSQMLTEHLQLVSRDKHLRVNYRAAPLGDDDLPGVRRVRRVPDGNSGGAPANEAGGAGGARRIRREPGGAETPTDGVRRVPNGGAGEASGNLGLEKIETLPGNLGYLDFSEFNPSDEALAKISEAMNRLADTDALIIDLRRCRGGASNTITLLMSYFFDKSTHLIDIYDRISNSTRESWSHASVPGRRYGQKDVYILTSNFTFSAAEDISYTLKNLQRARIVGETTGGGAHPVRGRKLNEHFFVMLPYARSISPITKTNWEGTGVEPDVRVPAAHALKTAQLLALKKLAASKPQDAQQAAQLKTLIEALQKEVDELKR
ncbi:MAG TPA: S41 family peptidase [Pyrinomonadaceae bacterium]